jgi:hypothetical protein
MIRLAISRHKTRVIYSDIKPTSTLAVGELIETITIEASTVPRVGELLTFHPDNLPTENSWTGEVAGVQHVIAQRPVFNYFVYPQTVCVTVRDERITE